MIRLSLIISTYNRSELLIGALKSVVAQTAPREEWECVVVNNNSTDDKLDRFDEFARAHPEFNLRIVTELNQGLSFARNRGIRESEGEYIAIIDDDERIAPEFIAAYIELFDTVPEAVAAGGPIVAEYVTKRPSWMSKFTERPIANTMYWGDKICEFPKGRVPGGGNMALRRSVCLIRRWVMWASRCLVARSATCLSVCRLPRQNITMPPRLLCIILSPIVSSPTNISSVCV